MTFSTLSRRALAGPVGEAIALTIVLAMHPACKRSPPPDAKPQGPEAPVLAPPAPSAVASGPIAPPSDAAARRAPEVDALNKELDARCAPKKAPQNNLEGKEAAAATADCLRHAFTSDMDAVLVPLKESDKPRFDALMKEQATWNKVVEDACWLAEEAAWVDLSAGTRDDGSARGTQLLACRQSTARERDWYARALAAGDIANLNRRFDDRDAAGTASIGRVIFVRVESHKLLQRGAPATSDGAAAAFPRPLTMPERAELESRARAIEDRIDELAKETCTDWPGLEALAGGAARCRVKATRYYFAHVDFAGDFSAAADP